MKAGLALLGGVVALHHQRLFLGELILVRRRVATHVDACGDRSGAFRRHDTDENRHGGEGKRAHKCKYYEAPARESELSVSNDREHEEAGAESDQTVLEHLQPDQTGGG